MRRILVKDIIDCLSSQFINVVGAYEGCYIDNLADTAHVTQTTLDWVNPKKTNKQEIVRNSPARVMLVDADVEFVNGKVLIFVKSPKKALAIVGNTFFVDKPEPGIHPTAIISPDAVVGKDVYIGPYSVIGKASIGDGCIIESYVRIYDNVVMGTECRIKTGAIIGGEGFGFEKDEEGNRFRFPQIGGVIMGHHVEVGGNTCIDRGALSDTIIGDYTKINNLCHIAHNNVIGKNVEITGCVNVSGGNTIENNVWIAPNASLVGYVHIGENSTIGMGAVVVKDIPANEVWVGNPARKLKDKKAK